METQTTSIPTVQTAERKATTTYTFREITEVDELEQAFRFRYEVYNKCKLNPFLNHNKNELDIDSFDLHSRHYGIFLDNNELIGYLRVVHSICYYYNNEVLNIGSKYGLFGENEFSIKGTLESKRVDFPFLSYQDLPVTIKDFYSSLRNENDKIVEPSRLVIQENHRGIKISVFLLESTIMLYSRVYKNFKHTFLSCTKEHSLIYKRYGFKAIGDEQGYILFDSSKLTTLTLYLPISFSSLPVFLHSKFSAMAAEYSITGKITKTL
jgi:predicted GNAT family N-acyltransferase